MAYTTPSTAAGGLILNSIWNASVRDNIIYLQDREDNPPRCQIAHSTTQSIANSTDTVVAFNTDDLDSAALHDTATNNSRITIPTGQGGLWLFTGYVEFAASATGQRKLALRVDGATVVAQQLVDAAAAGVTTGLNVALLAVRTASQYVELVVNQNSGGALNLSASPRFMAVRVA